MTDRPARDPHLYPHSALRAHPEQPGTHKAVLPLPAGLAAVVVADQAVTVPGALFGVEGESTSAVRTATFQLVVVSLSTEVSEAEKEFLELATLVAAGISFTPPTPAAREPKASATASPFGQRPGNLTAPRGRPAAAVRRTAPRGRR
ncbi:hypothetical protein [Streptomyces griseorubiginosus]|uniref:hypothetical protein n=1 Tax=Streptomyces griseorubiginosus TaxID=67304 RepID=UPI002E80D729|nr:hypothetical protein [Streptomyces griseorubiginosus]WUB43904.1 hypothetical protein OHN19_11380 [Streptomyces griseorubiginosus]WUB52422.1 hypothetical protein OG942_11375 [Streptomyces griseorubiginosus]